MELDWGWGWAVLDWAGLELGLGWAGVSFGVESFRRVSVRFCSKFSGSPRGKENFTFL